MKDSLCTVILVAQKIEKKQDSKLNPRNSRITDLLQSIKVEPIIVLLTVGASLIDVQNENLTIEKACTAECFLWK